MKKMTCKQLGGGCDQEFTADTFDEMASLSKTHGMEMIQKGDIPHLEALDAMRKLMNSPNAMNEWFENLRKTFDALPDSE
jgi:hypothetical protein